MLRPKFSAAKNEEGKIQTAQLLQIAYDLKILNKAETEVSDAIDFMVKRGFYCDFVGKKKDSYGPNPVPKHTLEETQEWMNLFLLHKLKRDEQEAIKNRANA